MHLSSGRRLATQALLLIFSGSLMLPAVSVRHATPDVDDRPLSGLGRQIAALSTDDRADDDHCAICHWLLAISGASAQAPHAIAVATSPAAPGAVGPTGRLGRSEVPALPSRAPPVRVP